MQNTTQLTPVKLTDEQVRQLLALNRKVDVLIQWVCHLVERTYDVEDLLKFPLHSENKNPNRKN